jgi:hypothetical protein
MGESKVPGPGASEEPQAPSRADGLRGQVTPRDPRLARGHRVMIAEMLVVQRGPKDLTRAGRWAEVGEDEVGEPAAEGMPVLLCARRGA